MEGTDTDTRVRRIAGYERVTTAIKDVGRSKRDYGVGANSGYTFGRPVHGREALPAGEGRERADICAGGVRWLCCHGGYGGCES
jgi:hypothetical protein